MVTEVKGVLYFFKFIDFVDDFGLDVGNLIVEVSLLGIWLEFTFETFFAH